MRIAIRVDASPVMGLGHLQRCLALAAALRETGAECVFVTRDLGVDTADRIARAGHPVHQLPAPASMVPGEDATSHRNWAQVHWAVDADETCHAITKYEPQLLVIDHYSFDADWHRTLANRLGVRIAVIDDLGDRDLVADVVIDHNYSTNHRAKYKNHIKDSAPILGGPSYALLGPGYASAPRYVVSDSVRSIGIFMGGTDHGGYTLMGLESLCKIDFPGQIEVVTTSNNPNLAILRKAVAARAKTKLSLDLPDLSKFFTSHDLQIGASGGATWERCCIGAPTLAIIVAENQRHVLEPLAELGVLQAVSQLPPTAQALAEGLRLLIDDAELRRRLAAHARDLVDGLGAKRVANYLINVCTPSRSSAQTHGTQ